VTTPSGGSVTVNPDHSFHNIDQTQGTGSMTINNGTGDLTDPPYPAFADFGNGDFHQVLGSVTIDAGADDVQNGSSDFDGEARDNNITDMGADEFYAAAPVATTQDASGVTKTTATLKGTVNPKYDQASFHFEYGKTPSYGSSTPTNGLLAAGNNVPVTADLTGLQPNTTYHFRLVASNTTGPDQGDDLNFKTRSNFPPGGNGVFDGFAIPKQAVRVKKGVVGIKGTCDPDARARCAGTLAVKSAKKIKLRVAKKKKKKAKIIDVGTGTISALPGQTKTVDVRISPAAKKAIRKHKLKTIATAIARDTSGASKTTTGRVTIKKKKKKKKHKQHAAAAAWSY
jgi:hypothetical protein